MSYYNHTTETSSCEPQFPATHMAVHPEMIGQTHLAVHPQVVGQTQMAVHPHMVGQQQMVVQPHMVVQPQPHMVSQPQMIVQPHLVGQPQMVVQPHMVAVQPHYPMQIAIGKYASRYPRITSVCLGVLQIGLSWLSIAAAVLATVFQASLWEIGTGYWCAVIYLIAGSIHLAAGVKPTNELITAATVLATLVVPFGIAQLIISVYSLVDSIACGDELCITTNPCSVAANAAMGNIGAFEMVFGLCLFIVGIRAMCCPPKSQSQMILLASDGTTGNFPTGLTTVTATTQNPYTSEEEDFRSDVMQNHHHPAAEATAPDYSLYERSHKGLD